MSTTEAVLGILLARFADRGVFGSVISACLVL